MLVEPQSSKPRTSESYKVDSIHYLCAIRSILSRPFFSCTLICTIGAQNKLQLDFFAEQALHIIKAIPLPMLLFVTSMSFLARNALACHNNSIRTQIKITCFVCIRIKFLSILILVRSPPVPTHSWALDCHSFDLCELSTRKRTTTCRW